ncbi:MAG TPA: response regulator [Gemmataceae bacterium]|nr:response regulator [Gemmataceae bacterium]
MVVRMANPDRPLAVLVVDDHPDTATSFVHLLGLAGHTVVTACDGPSALAAVALVRPDAVLMDVGLPGEDGYRVAKQLCDRLGYRPLLIAVTGHQGLERRSQAAGFDHHLLKPADPDELLHLLADYTAGAARAIGRAE